jgi:4-alpha-glucanotransferase
MFKFDKGDWDCCPDHKDSPRQLECHKSETPERVFKQNEHWLVSYSAFSYLRDLHGTVDFNSWPTYSKFDQKEVDQLTGAKSKTYHDIAFYYFVQ